MVVTGDPPARLTCRPSKVSGSSARPPGCLDGVEGVAIATLNRSPMWCASAGFQRVVQAYARTDGQNAMAKSQAAAP